ncbi:MAG: hypothetical protein U1E29_08835 [Coriobacteriia bacterium]|nr:hypothetical protein [Coriobacteriia bacterium]
MKRISILFVLTIGLSLVFAGAAFANFGPHGGYVDDTDSCAGCHRAHTSFSTVGWTDQLGTEHASALLVGSATTMTEFCNACHGDLAPGASTNVVSGVFDSGPTGADTQSIGDLNGGVVVQYESESLFNAPLNGGGFTQMPDPYQWEEFTTVNLVAATSAHSMETAGPLWGAGTAVPNWPNLTCTDCHDPHGTSNYRLLKGSINGNTVGGYGVDGETPDAFVFSYETGYPDPTSGVLGWLKHEDGAAQMVAYKPDYTGGTKILHQDATGAKSMSVWCAACHENYATAHGNTADNGGLLATYNYDVSVGAPLSEDGVVGAQVRHRHPVDVTLAAGWGPGRALQEQVKSDKFIPLELDLGNTPGDDSTFYQNYIGCLTCHRAHGASAEMTGWSAAHLDTNAAGTVIPVQDGIPGVSPAKDGTPGIPGDPAIDGSSALLRVDERGVCERCHNK